MNKVIFIGRLAQDPEPKNTKGGLLYVKFSLAVNRRVKKGEEKTVDYFNCTAFNYTAENIMKYLHKGSQIALEGRGQIDKYQDKDGNKREKFSVVVDSVEFLSDGGSKQKQQRSADPLGDEFDGETDMEVPF